MIARYRYTISDIITFVFFVTYFFIETILWIQDSSEYSTFSLVFGIIIIFGFVIFLFHRIKLSIGEAPIQIKQDYMVMKTKKIFGEAIIIPLNTIINVEIVILKKKVLRIEIEEKVYLLNDLYNSSLEEIMSHIKENMMESLKIL